MYNNLVVKTRFERRSSHEEDYLQEGVHTETATLIKAYSFGELGDPAGYEEDLYQTPGGLYFLHVGGGEASPYPTEDIVRLAKTKVNEWIENH